MKYLVNPVIPFSANAPTAPNAYPRVFTIASEQSSLVLTLRDELELTQVTGNLAQVSVGGDGTVWGVDDAHQVHRFTGSGWELVPGSLRQISVGSAEHVWGVNANDEIFRFTGTGWVQVPGTLAQVAVGADGTVWGVQDNHDVLFRRYDSWEQIPGSLVQISVGRRTSVWGVDAQGKVFARRGNNWLELPETFESVSIASDGTAMGIDTDGRLKRWRGDGWDFIKGKLAQLSVGSASEIWGLDGFGQVHRNAGQTTHSLVQAIWSEDPRQQWHIRRHGDGSFQIENVHNNLVLEVPGGSLDEGVEVMGAAFTGAENQRWLFEDLGDGRFRFDAKHSGRTLHVHEHSLESGVRVIQRAWVGSGEQRWILSEVLPSSAIHADRVTLFDVAGHGGSSLALGLGRFSMAALAELGNDKVSSLKVPSGMRVTLFEHTNFQGRRRPFISDSQYVGNEFDDLTSSVIVEKVATFYTGKNYEGTASTLGVGKHNMDALGIPNDTLSSMRVPQGLVVVLYEHKDFEGEQWIYLEDTPDLGADFDNEVSSIWIRQLGLEIPRSSIRFGGEIKLRGVFGKWLIAEDDGGLRADAGTPGSRATFTVERHGPSQHSSHLAFGDIVALRTAQGRYVTAGEGGQAMSDATSVGDEERWIVVRVGDTTSNVFVSHEDRIAFRSYQDLYLAAGVLGGARADQQNPADASVGWEVTAYQPPNDLSEEDETSVAGGGPCGAAVCGKNVCSTEACGADACAAEACRIDAALASACAAAAGGLVICGMDVAVLNACGAALTGVGACGAAACGAAACGADVCAAAATYVGACGAEAIGVGVCGAAACGADACGIAACLTEACSAEACGIEANPIDACGVDAGGIDFCVADACGVNVCGINLCPADACAADACAIDLIPFVPGI